VDFDRSAEPSISSGWPQNFKNYWFRLKAK
jgi:hypothetical protein